MLTVGLTGGIGVGKSTVARRLSAYGAIVVDTDQLARDVVEPGTEGYAQVLAQFGPRVIAEDGSIDRVQLATEVFSDPGALEHLNAIVHPLVAARAAQVTAAAPADAVVVHEVPLLVEIGWADRYDVVVVVTAAPEVAVARIIASRGMSPDDAWARVHAQLSNADRVAVADYVIENDADDLALVDAVSALWDTLRPLAAAHTG